MSMIKFIKRFAEWLSFKQRLDNQSHVPPLFKEGEVWWCFIGENVGVEISGKGDLFTRPILILRRYNQYSFFGLALTTKQKDGIWYVPIEFNGKRQNVILSQGRIFDYRRLKEKMGADIRNISNYHQVCSRRCTLVF
jgi:mRNA interferase MazF